MSFRNLNDNYNLLNIIIIKSFIFKCHNKNPTAITKKYRATTVTNWDNTSKKSLILQIYQYKLNIRSF